MTRSTPELVAARHALDLTAADELHPFIYADSEWYGRPDDESIFARAVMGKARELAGPS